METLVIGTSDDEPIFDKISAINDERKLGLALRFYPLAKLSDKFILSFVQNFPDKNIIAIIKNTPTLIKIDNHSVIKSHLNWQSLTKRIVSAGRKSELILQACKLTAGMSVLDATAGFGHDSLILASAGASVVMLEQNALVALLLFYEHQAMNDNPNWQKLLRRIDIRHGDFLDLNFVQTLPEVDLVYLDPMFPADSYAAKVNKNMQILHELAMPPNDDDENEFLKIAQKKLKMNGKIVVKRPISAPFLAKKPPKQSVSNDAIRFDKY